MTNVRLKKYLHIIPFFNNLILRSEYESETFVLKGEDVLTTFPRLIPLLNGTRSEDEIVAELDDLDSQYIRGVLNELMAMGLIETVTSTALSDEEADRYSLQLVFFSHFTDLAVQDMLKKSKVTLVGLDQIGSRILTSLALSGVGEIIGIDWNRVTKDDVYQTGFYHTQDIDKARAEVCSEKIKSLNPLIRYTPVSSEIKEKDDILSIAKEASLLIVSFDEEQNDFLHLINDFCLESKIPWSSCHIEGFRGLLGPTVIPYQTPCYTCYEIRSSANIKHYEAYMAYRTYRQSHSEKLVHFGRLNSFANTVASAMSLEIVKFLTDIKPLLTYGKTLSIDFLEMKIEMHPILKFPRCPSCGLDAKKMPGEVVWSE
jgi:thiazole/oxazole-forming peptide maturase SagC family component